MFKMFNSEFYRIIKMPLTYILGILLLIILALSNILYNPINNTLYNEYNNMTSVEIYNKFINDPTQKEYYDEKIEEALSILNYFTVLNGRTNEVDICLQNAFNKYEILENEIPNGDNATLAEKYINFKNSLIDYKTALLNFEVINDIPYINYINIYSDDYKEYLQELTNLIKQCDYYFAMDDKAEASNALRNYYLTNNCKISLERLHATAMDFLDITINSIIQKISTAYNEYILYIDTVQNATSFNNGELASVKRKALIRLINGTYSFSNLLRYMLDFPYLSIYVDRTLVLELKSDLDSTYKAINMSDQNDKLLSAHKNAVASLKNIKLIDNLEKFKKSYTLILPTQEIVSNINTLLNNTVLINKTTLEENIIAYQDDTSPSYIAKYVGRYQNLSEMAYKLVIYETVLSTFKCLDANKQVQFYGETLDNFNEYEYTTLSTLYRYCLENGEYLTDYSMPYQFNIAQYEDSAIDFIGYGLRISLVVIIIIGIILSIVVLTREYETKSLRLTLAKPISRKNLVGGKLLAVFTLGVILLLISLIALIVYAKLFNYTFVNKTIISVFNGKYIIKISPLINLLIILISGIFEWLFVLSLIFMISSIFKKSYFALIFNFVSVSILYLLNWITSSNILCGFLPNTNIDFYKYFQINTLTTQDLFTKLFTMPVVSNMNIIFSLLVYTAYIVAFRIISNAIIRCRDF